jgi:hypothetical protein
LRKAAELGLHWKSEVVGEKLTLRVPLEIFNMLRFCGREIRMTPQRLAYVLLVKVCRQNMFTTLLVLERDGGLALDCAELQEIYEAEAIRKAAKAQRAAEWKAGAEARKARAAENKRQAELAKARGEARPQRMIAHVGERRKVTVAKITL